jgi:hypothetical protein
VARIPAASLLCLAALLLASGCTLGANEELKRVVEGAFPPGMESSMDSCEWGSSTYEHQPKSWYGCWGYSSGDFVRVAATIAAQLSRRDFAVTASRKGRRVELTGVLGAETVCVDVLGPGSTDGRNTSQAEIRLGPGDFFVDVWSIELRDGGDAACADLPAWEE